MSGPSVTQPGDHLGAAPVPVLKHVPAPSLGEADPSLDRKRGPLLERKYAGGVGPVLEGRAATPPVRPLDPLAADRTEARRTPRARAIGPRPRSCRAGLRRGDAACPATPPRTRAPRSPWADSATRRASSALRPSSPPRDVGRDTTTLDVVPSGERLSPATLLRRQPPGSGRSPTSAAAPWPGESTAGCRSRA